MTNEAFNTFNNACRDASVSRSLFCLPSNLASASVHQQEFSIASADACDRVFSVVLFVFSAPTNNNLLHLSVSTTDFPSNLHNKRTVKKVASIFEDNREHHISYLYWNYEMEKTVLPVNKTTKGCVRISLFIFPVTKELFAIPLAVVFKFDVMWSGRNLRNGNSSKW